MKPTSLLQHSTSALRMTMEVSSAIVGDDVSARAPVEHLGDLALAFRDEFKLDGVIEETSILSSLQAVAAEAAAPDRWLALFNSPLGAALRLRGRDLNTAMGFVLAQLPGKAS